MAEPKRTPDEILAEIDRNFQAQHARANQLLHTIKQKRADIKRQLDWFRKEEPDLIYRFYHQSYKAFIMTSLVEHTVKLFEELTPEGCELNSWYREISSIAVAQKFNDDSNQHWFEQLFPVLQGFWHTKYFLEQMLVAADELEEAPMILPSGWAAVLYLYNLR